MQVSAENVRRVVLGCRKRGCVKGGVISQFYVCSYLSEFARVLGPISEPDWKSRNGSVPGGGFSAIVGELRSLHEEICYCKGILTKN